MSNITYTVLKKIVMRNVSSTGIRNQLPKIKDGSVTRIFAVSLSILLLFWVDKSEGSASWFQHVVVIAKTKGKIS